MVVHLPKMISVIVPVYKVEPYLHKCVDSILSQTYTNLEVIIVDDGSPDGCPDICDSYASQDKRIKVIHQANAGVSAARNAGLDAAAGEYIGFVDSDDWIEPEYYEELYQAIVSTGSVIASTEYVSFYEGEESTQEGSGARTFSCILLRMLCPSSVCTPMDCCRICVPSLFYEKS